MILFIALIAASYILSNQIMPLEELKQCIKHWFNQRKLSHWWLPQQVYKYISHLFNCNACISFWLVLIVMGSWQLGLIAYLISCFVGRHLNYTSL